MLHEFIESNRDELIRRCRAKVGNRTSPPVTPQEMEYGVPLLLEQLGVALRAEQQKDSLRNRENDQPSGSSPTGRENARTAALHGKELLQQGYSVEQVVHGYGDVCQAVTELAREADIEITVNEFNLFNGLLDDAIAGAVASYGAHRDISLSAQGSEDIHARVGLLAQEQAVFLDRAIKAFDALRVGNIGLNGATAAVLEQSLHELRALIEKSLPEIRLSSGMSRSSKL